MGHGHQWQVKTTLNHALEAAKCAGAHILLYGHTHVGRCEQIGGTWVLNPGAIGGMWGATTYATVELNAQEIICHLKEL